VVPFVNTAARAMVAKKSAALLVYVQDPKSVLETSGP